MSSSKPNLIDFLALPTGELLDRLSMAGKAPSPDLIKACLTRQQELAPLLVQIFAESLHDDWPDADDPRWYRCVHAGNLLIAYREPAALPVFGAIYRDEDQFADLIGNFETDPHHFGPPAIPTFAAVVQMDSGRKWHYGKAMSVSILSTIGLVHPETRPQILDIFRAVLPALRPNGELDWDDPDNPDLNWGSLVDDLAILQDRESLPVVQALFARDMIDESFIDLVGYERTLEEGIEKQYWRIRPFDIIEDYQKRWLALERKSQHFTKQRVSAESPAKSAKIGRNAPCPCGSGRKYKHCHGKGGG